MTPAFTLCIVLTAVLLISSPGAARCPPHWLHFGESCYIFINDVVPWTSALVMCRELLGARMLEVETQDENDFIVGQMRVKGLQHVWQGLSDLVVEGEWVFNSNRLHPSFLPWRAGMPDDSHSHEGHSGEDCMVIINDGHWNDLWCEDIYSSGWNPSVVCEMEAENSESIG